jgi:hypothetical protein
MIEYFLYGMLTGIVLTFIILLVSVFTLFSSNKSKKLNDREWEA